MVIIRPPEEKIPHGVKVFLAGGITGCPDWRSTLIELLSRSARNMVLFNPLRDHVPDPVEQIKWEYARLRESDIISFWFPQESICPITLFELGSHLNRGKKIIVGLHPNYPRRLDVEVQVALAHGGAIVYSLESLAKYIENAL